MTVAIEKRFSSAEYHHLTEIGFFSEDDHIELIKGKINYMAAKGTFHTVCCSRLNKNLSLLLENVAIVRCQDPILLPSGSEPEPDFAIVNFKDDDYLSHHPTVEDIILVIEIADSSIEYDQKVKLELYAEANLNYYWIFNLLDFQLESYSNPYQKHNGKFAYSQQQIYLPHQTISLPKFPELILDLSKVFVMIK